MNISISISDWCSLFLEQAKESSQVYWVCTLDYQKQLFVSRSFESTWEVPSEALYHNKDIFRDFLIAYRGKEFNRICCERHEQNPTGVAFYKIKSALGQEKFIRDRYATLYDTKGNPVFAAGVAMDISQKMEGSVGEHDELYQKSLDLLKDRIGVFAEQNLPIQATLSKREQQCAQLLKQGHTAKQTAEKLFLSRRTVKSISRV